MSIFPPRWKYSHRVGIEKNNYVICGTPYMIHHIITSPPEGEGEVL